MIEKEAIFRELSKRTRFAMGVCLLILLVIWLVKFHPGLNFVEGVKTATLPFLTITPVATNTPTPTVDQSDSNPPTKTQPVVVSTTVASEADLNNAINIYRQDHGLSSLKTNTALCAEAQKRLQDLASLNVGRVPGELILNHDGIQQDLDSGRLQQLVGLHRYGENVASSFCQRPSDGVSIHITTGTQLVEWCFDSSPTHKENLLQPYWTDVCSLGQYPFYVEEFAY